MCAESKNKLISSTRNFRAKNGCFHREVSDIARAADMGKGNVYRLLTDFKPPNSLVFSARRSDLLD